MSIQQQAGRDVPIPPSVGEVVERLAEWRTTTQDVAMALQTERREVEAQSSKLESPAAVLEYVDFFLETFGGAVAEVGRISAEIVMAVRQGHVDALRQLASNAALEQRRCVIFRDKWINRTLPHEQMRPMLNRLSTLSRDRLAAYRDLQAVADTLLQILRPAAPPPSPGNAMDRRALFNRLLRRGKG